MKEPRLLEGQTAIRLKQTNRNPPEWIAIMSDGRRVHIVALVTGLLVSCGKDLYEALMKAKNKKAEKVPHSHPTRDVPMGVMLEATGMILGEDVEVNEAVPGDLA